MIQIVGRIFSWIGTLAHTELSFVLAHPWTLAVIGLAIVAIVIVASAGKRGDRS